MTMNSLEAENAMLRTALKAALMFRHPPTCVCAGCSDVRVLLAREPATVDFGRHEFWPLHPAGEARP